MDRAAFRQRLGIEGAAVIPVLQTRVAERAIANAEAATAAGAPGVFLVNHRFDPGDLLPVIAELRRALPDLWLGVNLRGQPPRLVFPVIGRLLEKGVRVDAVWTDDAEIAPTAEAQTEAEAVAAARRASGWDGLYFGGVALTAERPVPPADLGRAGTTATAYVDVVTTALSASAGPRDRAKLAAMRKAVGQAPLAIGSGVTPDTVPVYAPRADCLLVARAASRDPATPDAEQEIDPERLSALVAAARAAEPA